MYVIEKTYGGTGKVHKMNYVDRTEAIKEWDDHCEWAVGGDRLRLLKEDVVLSEYVPMLRSK